MRVLCDDCRTRHERPPTASSWPTTGGARAHPRPTAASDSIAHAAGRPSNTATVTIFSFCGANT